MGLFCLGPYLEEDKTPENYIKAVIANCELWLHDSKLKNGRIGSPIFKGNIVEGSEREYADLYMLEIFAKQNLDDAIDLIKKQNKHLIKDN